MGIFSNLGKRAEDNVGIPDVDAWLQSDDVEADAVASEDMPPPPSADHFIGDRRGPEPEAFPTDIPDSLNPEPSIPDSLNPDPAEPAAGIWNLPDLDDAGPGQTLDDQQLDAPTSLPSISEIQASMPPAGFGGLDPISDGLAQPSTGFEGLSNAVAGSDSTASESTALENTGSESIGSAGFGGFDGPRENVPDDSIRWDVDVVKYEPEVPDALKPAEALATPPLSEESVSMPVMPPVDMPAPGMPSFDTDMPSAPDMPSFDTDMPSAPEISTDAFDTDTFDTDTENDGFSLSSFFGRKKNKAEADGFADLREPVADDPFGDNIGLGIADVPDMDIPEMPSVEVPSIETWGEAADDTDVVTDEPTPSAMAAPLAAAPLPVDNDEFIGLEDANQQPVAFDDAHQPVAEEDAVDVVSIYSCRVPEGPQAAEMLEILGLDHDATWGEARDARRALLAEHNPEDASDEERAALANAICREMNTAYAGLRLLHVA